MAKEILDLGFTDKLITLKEAAALEYLIGWRYGDRDQALKAGKELIVLACTEQLSLGGKWLEIVRDELLYAAYDFDLPAEALDYLPIYTNDARELRDLPRISSASVRPGGTYNPAEIIEGFYEGDLQTTV